MKKYSLLAATVTISVSLFAQTAPGYSSLAVGINTAASGQYSFATGYGSQAKGQASVALGNATAEVNNSFSMGYNTRATGQFSTAMGYGVTTNTKVGSFIIGDATDGAYLLGNDANNQMMMRFLNGYKFFANGLNLALAITPNGTVGIDQSNTNTGTVNSGLIFGNSSGEGIGSKRNPGGNQYGLDFYSNFTSRLSITNGGNIGIGTQSPAAKFSLSATGEDLAGTACSRVFKTYSGVLGTNAGAEIKLASFGFRSGNWSSLGITAYRFNGADGWQNAAILFGYDVDNSPGAGSFFALAGNGNFGIGTASPSAKLHVAGNILATGTITPSDIRYKKDITLIDGALKKISSLSGYYYSFKTKEFPDLKFDSKEQVGVIAQDVEKVLPEVVYTLQNGYKAVDYPKLIPLLIEGIKELERKVDELKNQLQAVTKKQPAY